MSINTTYMSIKSGHPSGTRWARDQSRRSQYHEKHTSRGRGGGNEPPAGLTGQSPDNPLGNFIFLLYSLDDVVIKPEYGCSK